MTPMKVSYRKGVPTNVYSVDVGLHDTAASRLIDLLADGTVMTEMNQPKSGQYSDVEFVKRIAIKE